MKVFWFFFSKKNRSSFVNKRNKKLHPFLFPRWGMLDA